MILDENIFSALPMDVTVLNFVFDPNDVLWLIRYCHDREPYPIPLCQVKNAGSLGLPKNQVDPMFLRLQTLLEDNNATTAIKDIDPREFWSKRRQLDTNLKVKIIHSLPIGKLSRNLLSNCKRSYWVHSGLFVSRLDRRLQQAQLRRQFKTRSRRWDSATLRHIY
jgi:hypothetical protein